ncbi:collagen-like protein [bacterium]|nr:collagen-like protein [bacterium]
MKRMLTCSVMVIALGLAMALTGCGDDGDTGPAGATGPTGPPGAAGEVTNDTCLAANCHGNASLVKTIVRNDAGKEGVQETIPLYVDNTLFSATVHGGQRCVGCHDDINAAGGAHGPVVKTFGGWARFSAKQAVETIAPNEFLRTRNYFTAASRSCVACHSNHADFPNSAHATIFKMRNATVDTALRTAAQAAFPGDTIGALGESYMAGDCNRCHAACSTCHFKSTVTRAVAGNPLDFWDNNMSAYPAAGWNDKMTEFAMDWTTNVRSHEFRRGSYFDNDTEGVCEACHTGLYKPAKDAYYWAKPGVDNTVGKVKATDGKRHMQTYELLISGIGNTAVLTGGNNTAHAAMACAACHGGSFGDLHALPGLPYLWDAPTYPQGDVHCTDCHSATHANAAVALHLDNTGTSVACVGCHAFGMARDFMFASGAAVDNSTDVFLDPESNQVRPVIYKHGLAKAWYPHNWQTLNPGTGLSDPTGDCARKCHYAGNPVGASAP